MKYSEKANAAGRAAYAECRARGGSKLEAMALAKRATRATEPKEQQRSAWKQAYKTLKTAVIEAYGGHCKGCGEREHCCLTIDHVFDDGAEERRQQAHSGGVRTYQELKKKGFPQDRYQLLCGNCQLRKRTYGPDIKSWPTPNA